MFYYYMIYGKKVFTDLYYPQLVACSEITKEEADIVILAADIPREIKDKEAQDEYWSFGREQSWLINRTCWFVVSGGREITYERKEGGREDYLKTYLLGYGLSMLFLQRGEMTIHCSALAKGDKAILVAGESGSGKSTTTAALLEAGFTLMADDMALVSVSEEGKVVCYPAFPYQKLCRDAALEQGYKLDELIFIDEDKDKYLVPYKGEFSVEGKELKAFFFLRKLRNAERVDAREIAGMDKFRVCANNLFLRNLLLDEKYSPAVGSKCLEIASKVDMYFLGRPKEGDTVRILTDYIIEKTE